MAQKRIQNTKLEILRCATDLFLKKGYTEAYVTTIANTLGISTGNLTFHYPTKEHLLAELVKELCEFQWKMEENEGASDTFPMIAYLLELVTFASICMENSNISDLIIAAYTHSMSIEIIRKNDTKRAMRVFGEYCPQWTEIDFIKAENIVSGIEYSMYITENTERITFEQRVSSSIDAIMKIYEVPKEVRENVVNSILSSDYYARGSKIFEKFCKYVEDKGMRALEEN